MGSYFYFPHVTEGHAILFGNKALHYVIKAVAHNLNRRSSEHYYGSGLIVLPLGR